MPFQEGGRGLEGRLEGGSSGLLLGNSNQVTIMGIYNK